MTFCTAFVLLVRKINFFFPNFITDLVKDRFCQLDVLVLLTYCVALNVKESQWNKLLLKLITAKHD